MSEATRPPVGRSSRAERTTTSCGECRRRKQKCNQGQPCSNCARRFPQPLCEYKPSSRRPSVTPISQQSAFAISVLPSSGRYSGKYEIEGARHPLLPPRQTSSSWAASPGGEIGAVTVRWSGIDLGTQLPVSAMMPQPHVFSRTQGGLLPEEFGCNDGCTVHPDLYHDAANLLRTYYTIPARFLSGTLFRETPSGSIDSGSLQASGVAPWPGTSPDEGHGHIPRAPGQPIQDNDLLNMFINLIGNMKASIDSSPDAANPYIQHYIPFCLRSPLLTRVAICTAAGWLHVAGIIDTTVAMAHKGQAIALLNEHIKSSLVAGDEGIAGVVQLIINEWYWGEKQSLHAHMGGLCEMIKLRGGFRTLGLNGLISKLAITSDVGIALCFEIPPSLRGGPEFDFQDSTQPPLQLALNTPLIPMISSGSLPHFASCHEEFDIDPTTASILDDMRFLVCTVLGLPENASPTELQKLHHTAAWTHDQMLRLSTDGPVTRRPSPRPANAPSPAVNMTPESQTRGVVEGNNGLTAAASPTTQSTQQFSAYGLGVQQQATGRSSEVSAGEMPKQGKGSLGEDLTVQPSPESPDYVYQAIRTSAILYTRAIMTRRPFSEVVSMQDFLELWTTAWRVPLAKWRSLLGVFNWMLLPLISSVKNTGHDLWVKSMMNTTLLQMGMGHWEIAHRTMDAAMRLQRWLKGDNVNLKENTGSSNMKPGSSRSRSGSARNELGKEFDERRGSDDKSKTTSLAKGKGKEAEPR
ncbi:uncharacterized protein B0T23DRAFT_5531 [Neurospora hispaniola]|uniref:Zn(2)-C6 fungal-type domain-containing protein n=1 Tax=Neurospora hispaniola TaxID=588809 RepID=A0AAJ0IEM8_9PEZI|nr:hypothetical protein B0T23DRAFT_5531 [Neurospora hispaniola]